MARSDEGGGWDADRVRRTTAAVVALLAGLVLLAWSAKLESLIESDALASLSPLSCVGFLACAAGL